MKVEFKPRSVRELLTEMKDISDLMIDLSYAAVLFESEELADRVHTLEARMDELMYHIRVIAAVAARNVREAHKITGILQVASAAEAISNATADIADLIRREIKIHPVVHDALRIADEKLVKVRINEGSILAGKKLQELRLPSSIGLWILALKRGKELIIQLPGDTELRVGDLLVAKGPEDGVLTLCGMAGAKVEAVAPGKEMPFIRKALAEMRDLSSVMVDFAYSAILLGSREVAEEVRELEEEFDKLNYKLWLATLTAAARLESDVPRLNSVLQIVKCMEKISDAADSIVDVVLRKLELHPVFVRALAETDEKIARVWIGAKSPLVGKSLGELNLWATMGVYVLLITRDGRHIFDPGRKVRLRAGDSLTVRGYRYGVEKLKRAAAARA